MANPKPSFDDFIQADRKRRKAEALAQQMLGRNRGSKAVSSGRNSPANGGSLASRVGIAKRPFSPANSIRGSGASIRSIPPQSTSRLNAQRPRNERALESAASFRGASRRIPDGSDNEISIRGAAGPYCVVAQNFVGGTTASDIESVFQPFGGDIVSCRVIAATPTVIAEILFADRSGAENVIATFNNKKADGRLLYVFMKNGPPTAPAPAPAYKEPLPEPEAAPASFEEEPYDDVIMQIDEVPSRPAASLDNTRAQRNVLNRDRHPDTRDSAPRGPRGPDPYFGNRQPRGPAFNNIGRSQPKYGNGDRFANRDRRYDEGRLSRENDSGNYDRR